MELMTGAFDFFSVEARGFRDVCFKDLFVLLSTLWYLVGAMNGARDDEIS